MLVLAGVLGVCPLLAGADCVGMADEACRIDRVQICVSKQEFFAWAAAEDATADAAGSADGGVASLPCPSSADAHRFTVKNQAGTHRFVRELAAPVDHGDECCYDYESEYGECE